MNPPDRLSIRCRSPSRPMSQERGNVAPHNHCYISDFKFLCEGFFQLQFLWKHWNILSNLKLQCVIDKETWVVFLLEKREKL